MADFATAAQPPLIPAPAPSEPSYTPQATPDPPPGKSNAHPLPW